MWIARRGVGVTPHTPQLSETARLLEESGPADGGRTPAEPAETGTTVRSTLELVALVIAPTTLLTALAFYFGWTLTNARARYFAIDPSTLGFSTSDYVLRSVDALYVPVAVLAVAGLVVVGIHSIVDSRLADPRVRGIVSLVAWGLVAVGIGLLVIGVVSMFESLPRPHYLFPSLSGGIGAALIAYGLFIVRGGLPRPALGLLVAFVVLSLFWTASVYASALGRGRAQDVVSSLERQPRVFVYSTTRLQLPEHVQETRLDPRQSAYAFRYSGLRLLIRSGGNYFLLNEGWTRDDGVTILLRDDDDLRFEFRPGE
jgi:hypothetical protein